MLNKKSKFLLEREFFLILIFVTNKHTEIMKNINMNFRPFQAIVATGFILIAILALSNYQYSLVKPFLFSGCFIFGMIFQGIHQENKRRVQ